ncbi:MAG TPA: hypothetical protein VKN99_03705 [Polyangia bacterium]|nr:hypothetical protein [Polyangia bacterium]
MADESRRDKLTRTQLELVLRRAAELEQSGGQADELVSEEEAERAGLEAGLSREALQRALAEVRVGGLAPAAPPTALDRTIGPAALVVERVVPGPLAEVRARVERFLRGQLMRVKRNFGDRVVWQQAQGFWPGLVRAFDWSRQYALAQGVEIESAITEEPDGSGRVRVRMKLDVRALRRTRAGAAAAGLVLGAGAVVSGLFLHAIASELVVLAAGGGLAGVSVLASRRAYRRDLDRLQIAIERFFDALEHER